MKWASLPGRWGGEQEEEEEEEVSRRGAEAQRRDAEKRGGEGVDFVGRRHEG